MTTMESPATVRTLADLLDRLGGVAPDRVRFDPPPGTATEDDLLRANHQDRPKCELVDRVLVEKAMGYAESFLAGRILILLSAFVDPRNLGLVTGADAEMRLFEGLIRLPDVAFAAWERLPDRKVPAEPIADLAPNLAVEVLSRSNTEREMSRKREEYFRAGVEIVWMVDPRQRTVTVFTSPTESVVLTADDVLDGGDVLPGFSLPLKQLFDQLDRKAEC